MNFNWYGKTEEAESQKCNTKQGPFAVTEQHDDVLEDLSYFEANLKESEETLLSAGEEMQYDIDENEEFNSYTDTTQIGKRIFMAPDPAFFSPKFFLTKVKATRVMHLSQEKHSINQTSKNNTSKRKKKVSFEK